MTNWPSSRGFPFAPLTGLESLQHAWNYSSSQISEITASIKDDRPAAEVSCIAVSGSLARMEAHPGSDIDVLVVYDDVSSVYSAVAAEKAYNQVWDGLAASPVVSGLKRPKPGGIFSSVARVSLLTNPEVRGIVDEEVTPYGQRMQLLLDSQPVYHADRFTELQRSLLNWYAEHRIQQLFNEAGPFHWLWQDIQRYWRSIRARACWLHADEPRKSLEVNLKLRSSRLAIITSMLWAIERSHEETPLSDCIETLLLLLRRTPTERLTDAVGPQLSQRLLNAYQTIWQHTSQLTADAVKPEAAVLQAISDFKACLLQISKEKSDWSF